MKCMNCGAPVDDLSYYCWDCTYGLKAENSISTQNQDETNESENAQEEQTQSASPEFVEKNDGEAIESSFQFAFPEENLEELGDRLKIARGILIGDILSIILPHSWDERTKISELITDMKRFLYIRKVYNFRRRD